MFLLFLLFLPLASAEVITLTKRDSISCVLTQDSVYSALDLSATARKYTNFVIRRPLQVLNRWTVDDWDVGTTKEHSFYPVMDIRWEGFQSKTAGHISLNSKSATSLSICHGQILMMNIEMMKTVSFHHTRSNTMNCEWVHYMVDGNNIVQLSGGNERMELLKAHPSYLNIQSTKMYKIHNYDFRYSTQTTRGRVSSIDLTNLTTSSYLCISFFVSIDLGCHLDVTLQSGSRTNLTIPGFNTGTIRKWKRIEIKTDSYNRTGSLEFHRRGTKPAFWAIDKIHLCKPEIEIFTQTVTSPHSYRCTTLEKTHYAGDIRCETPGFLGQNCTIRCSSILEDSASFCQGYRICSEKHCGCAWGYQGEFCEKPCDNGYQGLSCSSNSTRTTEVSNKTPVTLESQETTEMLRKVTREVLREPSIEMPEEVLLSTTEVILNFNVLRSSSTYLLNLHCLEEWCLNKVLNITLEAYTNETKKKVALTPFSRYDIEVVAQKSGEKRRYEAATPPSRPHPVQNLSIYSSTKDTFWLRWKQPYPPTGIVEMYHITYQSRKDKEKLSSNSTFACRIWTDYVCAQLTGLKPNIFYHIEVHTKNINVSKWSTPGICGFTTEEKQSDPPGNLHLNLSSSNETVLKWEYPNYTHGLLENFVVEVDDGHSKNTTVVKISGNQYEQKFAVGQNQSCVVTVWGVNSSPPSKAELRIGDFEASPTQTTKSGGLTTISIVSMCIISICVLVVLVFLGYFYGKSSSSRYCKNTLISSEEEIYLLPQVPSTDIKNENLEDYVKSLYDSNKLNQLKQLFYRSMENKNKSCKDAFKKENINKNKDQVYIPYDCTRVVLEDLKGVGSGDYINASYLDGYQHAKTYIACQGPKFNTVGDFWRMIWGEKIEVIVMTTDFIDSDGSRNCAEYWSHGLDTLAEFGQLSVKMTTEELYQHYDFRTFDISYQGMVRQVRHLQTRWYQNRYPHSDEVLPVLQKLRQLDTSLPIVVHSGFGSKRNGMLILCDIMLEIAKSEGTMNFVKMLEILREQRPRFIDDFRYFLVAHLTVLEFFLQEKNPFKKPVDEILTTNCTEEVEFLERINLHNCVLLSELQKTKDVTTKIEGYRQNYQFLFHPQPTKTGMLDFWETTVKDIQFILVLNLSKAQLWPLELRKKEIILTVEVLDVKQISSCCSLTQLSVKQRVKNNVLSEKKLWVYELLDWPLKELIPGSLENILCLLQDLRSAVKEKDKILIVSHVENNASALTTVLFNTLEKYERTREIDVYGFLRAVMRSDQGFKIQPVEVQFLYNAIVEYLNRFDLKKHVYEYMK